jgi:Cu/Ag efflux protein CusF
LRTAGAKTARLLVAVLLVAFAACRGGEALSPAAATYTVRGQVLEVPREAGGELTVHHEAVPGFHDRQGRPSPMDSMSMPFAVAPEVSLSGVAPGDRVQMTFEVRWQGGPPLRVVALHELPATTELALDGPTFELVYPLGSGSAATPTPAPSPSGSPRPATDGPSSLPPARI